MKRTFTFFSDSGHGWLQVPLALLSVLNVRPSHYSYYDRKYGYLEEDIDAGEFFAAYDDELQTVNEHTNGTSSIRALRRFSDGGAS